MITSASAFLFPSSYSVTYRMGANLKDLAAELAVLRETPICNYFAWRNWMRNRYLIAILTSSMALILLFGCSSLSKQEIIATATVSQNEAAQLAAVALSTDPRNVAVLENDVWALFHECPGGTEGYSTKWHVAYGLLHIPDDLEQTSLRVIEVDGTTDLPHPGVDIDGSAEGARILDELLSMPNEMDRIQKQNTAAVRCE